MTAIIGETIGGQYIPMPPPSGSPYLTNGQAVGANVAMVYDSNTSVLVRESCRHLVHSLGPPWTQGGKQWVWSAAGNQFSGVANTTSPGNSFQSYQQIPWGDRRSSIRFGPFPAAFDQSDGNGNNQMRPVKMMIDLTPTGSFTDAHCYFAMAPTASGTQMFQGNFFDFVAVNGIASGSQIQTSQTMAQSGYMLLPPQQTDTCRSASFNVSTGAYGLIHAPVLWFWLWFGWYFVGTGNLTINGFSAWEIRQ